MNAQAQLLVLLMRRGSRPGSRRRKAGFGGFSAIVAALVGAFALIAAYLGLGWSGSQGASSAVSTQGHQQATPQVAIEKLHVPGACDRTVLFGDRVGVLYVGRLENGTVFIASPSPKDGSPPRPMEFVVGAGEVLRGWEQGTLGMCEGERRRLTIPPKLGFGVDRDVPVGRGTVVPANSTLVFEVELLSIVRPAPPSPASSSAMDATDASATAGSNARLNESDAKGVAEQGRVQERELSLRETFDSFDTDRNGKLSKEELKAHMRTIKYADGAQSSDGAPVLRQHTEAEIEAMWQQHHGEDSAHPDRDGDGEISWEEWDPTRQW